MNSQVRLILIAPYWTEQVEQLIAITKDNFDVSVLTSKIENFQYHADKVEVLQCFGTLSPWEMIKMTPWFLQKQPAVFHFFINYSFSASELMGLSSLISMIKSLPSSQCTYSLSVPQTTWGRLLLKPLFDGSEPLSIWNPSNLISKTLSQTNILTPKSGNSFFTATNSRDRNSSSFDKNGMFNDSEATQKNSSRVDIYDSDSDSYSDSDRLHIQNNPIKLTQNKIWLIPYPVSEWTSQQKKILKVLLHLKPDIQIAIPDWGNYPLRKRHHWRNEFLLYSHQIHIPFRFSWDTIRNSVETIVFAGGFYIPWNEMDLIQLAQNQKTIIIDHEQRKNLEAPWSHADQLWILQKEQLREDLLKFFQSKDSAVRFQNLDLLLQFQDYKSNQLLRAISEKGVKTINV